jgi:hypothetical protein
MSEPTVITDFGPGPTRFRDPFDPRPWFTRVDQLVPNYRPNRSTVDHYRRAHFQGDPAADAVVEWMHRVGFREARPVFERALEHGVDTLPSPPEPLRALFEEIDAVPAWLDRGKLEHASRVAERVALGQNYVLFSISLLGGYVSAGITKTLVATGELETMAPRRIGETSKFVEDVYRSPGLARTSDGFKSAIRVRMMHAFVRHKLLRSGWDTERWGLPISQADMAGTVLSFSVTYLLGLRALGFVIRREERAAVIHLWRYVGRLLGVHESLLATNEKESLRLLWLVARSQEGPDEDGRALARALLQVPVAYRGEGALGGALIRFDTAFCAGLTRWFIGDVAADGLGLPDTAWKYAVLLVAPANLCAEAARAVLPGATSVRSRLGRALNALRQRTLLGDRPATFEPRTVASTP